MLASKLELGELSLGEADLFNLAVGLQSHISHSKFDADFSEEVGWWRASQAY